MTRLIYRTEELEAEHDYPTPHVECGQRLHGGFDLAETYISPRSRYRVPAIKAWQSHLERRQVPLVEASVALLARPHFPSKAQQVFLLQQDVARSFWDSLTMMGRVQAHGQALAELDVPDFQSIIAEDISSWALGHLDKGLLSSHGWDEGGRPGSGVGGHDTMLFAARDLLFGHHRYPLPPETGSVGRPTRPREMHQLPPEHESMLVFLMDRLMTKVRALRVLNFFEAVIGAQETFCDRRREAAHATQLIARIRQDKAIHLAWLRVMISEFRGATVQSVSGGRVRGADILNPVWQAMVHWHAIEMYETTQPSEKATITQSLLALTQGDQLLNAFEALST